MGKPLVRFCEGPGINEGQEVRGTRHVVVACDEAFHESLVEHLISDHLKTSVYSKRMEEWKKQRSEPQNLRDRDRRAKSNNSSQLIAQSKEHSLP
jgi:hypothetical protein